MLFNSFSFLIFFPVVTVLYFLLPHRWRWLHLLIASCVFYCFFIPAYLLILVVTILIDYVAGIYIEHAVGKRRKWLLLISIVANVGVLAVFKYFNFFVENINGLLQALGTDVQPLPYWNMVLPIGLSFHTFQAMSYTIEVYRGKQQAERHLGIYALYVMFYPQLVAGPIERPQNLLHQFREKHHFDSGRVAQGLRWILWGLFMKVVVADRMATYVNPVFNNIEFHNGTTALAAIFFFTIQIYCDFAGYSLIAIGSAKTMGFTLMENFNRPYFSTSIAQFWSRWHTSLSTWFRDYVYIPLGGNRVKVPRWYFNLFFVFLVSGLWHGADWKFVVWGALHGAYLIIGLATQKLRSALAPVFGLSKIPVLVKLIQGGFTFLLCAFAWIFFRANSLDDAFLMIHKAVFDHGALFNGNNPALIPYCAFGIILLFAVEFIQEYYPGRWLLLGNHNVYVRHTAYVMMILIILLLGVFDAGQFIYFQF